MYEAPHRALLCLGLGDPRPTIWWKVLVVVLPRSRNVHGLASVFRLEHLVQGHDVKLCQHLVAEVELHNRINAAKPIEEGMMLQCLAAAFVEELEEHVLRQGLQELQVKLLRLLAMMLSLNILLDAQCMTGGDAMRTTVVADRVKNLLLPLTLSVYVGHGVRDAADEKGRNPQGKEARSDCKCSLWTRLKGHVVLHGRGMDSRQCPLQRCQVLQMERRTVQAPGVNPAILDITNCKPKTGQQMTEIRRQEDHFRDAEGKQCHLVVDACRERSQHLEQLREPEYAKETNQAKQTTGSRSSEETYTFGTLCGILSALNNRHDVRDQNQHVEAEPGSAIGLSNFPGVHLQGAIYVDSGQEVGGDVQQPEDGGEELQTTLGLVEGRIQFKDLEWHCHQIVDDHK
mmetsp:Transcript_41449/g.96825  ORF Transcript_41449/g.96825 Transcript_41449/m.96825 type:complete len:400 (-) Transcript_41449:828-2027(-)